MGMIISTIIIACFVRRAYKDMHTLTSAYRRYIIPREVFKVQSMCPYNGAPGHNNFTQYGTSNSLTLVCTQHGTQGALLDLIRH